MGRVVGHLSTNDATKGCQFLGSITIRSSTARPDALLAAKIGDGLSETRRKPQRFFSIDPVKTSDREVLALGAGA